MLLKYIDTHCHIHFKDFDEERAEMLESMRIAGVGAVAIGTDLQTSKDVVALAREHAHIWACIGVHPNDADDFQAVVDAGLSLERVVAIGECGLDYFRSDGTDEAEVVRQKRNFRAQIEYAIEKELPVMLHIRSSEGTQDAHEDALEILAEYKAQHGDALRMHCHFTTFGKALAEKFLVLDATFGIPGVVTYKSAQDLQDVVRYLPLERMVSETDAPYAAPVPHRGKRNEPLFVIDIVHAIADLRGEEREVVRKQLLENTKKIFNLGVECLSQKSET
jgi:TatD DNase family protein